jgi:hypothetical protein
MVKFYFHTNIIEKLMAFISIKILSEALFYHWRGSKGRAASSTDGAEF